jgi:hypothetical protein
MEDQKSPKNAKMGIFERQGDTYAVIVLTKYLLKTIFLLKCLSDFAQYNIVMMSN